MLLVGLAVGVDYCMFYLRREREERARGRDPETALRIAAATSGRSVLVSGLTVVVAMSGMFLSGMLLFEGFAHGRDPGRPGRGPRLGDRAARRAVPARRPGRLRAGARAGPDAATQRRQQGLGRGPQAGPEAARRLGAGRRRLPARARRPGGRHPHRAAEPRPAAAGGRQHHAELPPDHGGVPRRTDSGGRRDQGARRPQRRADRRGGGLQDAGPGHRPRATSRSSSRCTPTRTCWSSRCRWPATGRTPPRSAPWTPCGRRRPGDAGPRARHRGVRRREPRLLAGLQRPAAAA